jgi:hypothetical protein
MRGIISGFAIRKMCFFIGSMAGLVLVSMASAGVIDLEALSVAQRRIYCVVYIDNDGRVQVSEGRMSQAEYDGEVSRLGQSLWLGADRSSAMGNRIGAAFETIRAAQPTRAELAATAKACRAFLRL